MIEVNNLSFSYSERNILENYNLRLYHGHYRIRGANGSGKSTLLKLITGEVKPSSGNVRINGIDINDISSTELFLDHLSFARQENDLILDLTVNENLEMYNVDMDVANDLLVKFDIDIYQDSKIKQLSGGERKRYK